MILIFLLICVIEIEARNKKLQNAPKIPKEKIEKTKYEEDEFKNWKVSK